MAVLATMAPARAMNFVGGRWVESKGRRSAERRNPANSDDLIGIIPLSTREETRAVVDVAAKALPGWRSTPAPVRAKVLARACQIMTERKDELAHMLTREEGKSVSDA